LVVSEHLLYELQVVLSREKFRRYLTIAEVEQYLLWLRDHAELVEIEEEDFLLEATADPDDDYLLALTISAGAQVLVSGDPHVLEASSGSSIFTPSEFLGQLLL
jgi:putative PIN family toxin of toxin-antitoxin system